MRRKHEAAAMVKSGTSPSGTAQAMGITTASVKQYLLLQIAEGELTRTDVLRSINGEAQDAYEEYVVGREGCDYASLARASGPAGFDQDEFRLYVECKDSHGGDMYRLLASLELFLHEKVRRTLITQFGPEETGWWKKGIQTEIRKHCVQLREDDPNDPSEPYSYTTMLHLWRIIDKNWDLFQKLLPTEIANDRHGAGVRFRRLNNIRNAVMHPVKRFPFSCEDFTFVEQMVASIGSSDKWRE